MPGEMFRSVKNTHIFVNPEEDIHLQDHHGNTPLHTATTEGNLNIIKSVLEYGASVNSVNNRGETALHIATQRQNFEAITLLLSYGANTNILDVNKRTCLHYLLRSLNNHRQWASNNDQNKQNLLNTVKELLSNEARSNIKDCDGETVVHLAVKSQQQDLMNIILEDAKQKDVGMTEAKKVLFGGVAVIGGVILLGLFGLAKLDNN